MELLPRGGTWHQMSEIKGGIGPREERFLGHRGREATPVGPLRTILNELAYLWDYQESAHLLLKIRVLKNTLLARAS